jgi:hypothetical protein
MGDRRRMGMRRRRMKRPLAKKKTGGEEKTQSL